ncbi:hypothetical protein EON65_19540 [archaeon]|nr:MAG: hypothetical protein EON65_19540 [archaeon]
MKSLVPGFLKKRDDKYVGARTSMKLDSGTVIPFIDLLETAVRKKAKSPAVSLKLLDNKQTTEVIDHFSNGFRNRISLDKNDTNVLWSAAIKIIKMSDPIFSDRNCTTLQTANAQDVSNIASFLPVHHQQLLGALLSASEMIIRIDNNSANLAADTLSSVLIWNSAPGSLMNRHAFCNLINNQRHDFPYCHSFERKLNLTVAPLSSDEWIAILEITAADLTTFEDRRRRLVEPIVSDRVEVLDEKPTISSLTAADSIQNFSILTPASIPVDSSLVLADVSKISRANNSTISALDISHGTDRSSNVVSANEVVGPSNKSNLGCVPKDTLSAKPKTRSESTTLQTLQIVFQRCFITRDDLVDLRLRQIDLDEDYADLS